MNDLGSKVSYLRGLADGMRIEESSDSGKVLIGIIDILDDIVDAMAELEASQAELDEYVETIDEDLSDMEDQMYGDEEIGEYDEEPHYIEVECPNCHETVYFDEDLFDSDDDVICPNCDKTIYSDEDEDSD